MNKGLSFMVLVLSALFIMYAGNSCFAVQETQNGGDSCEKRIVNIRDDIASWIQGGGSAYLTLPINITLNDYNQKMLEQIQNAEIICTEKTVSINDAEKTCKNITKRGKTQIICNRRAFLQDTTEDEQYVLIHHEYAGLSGFELNNGTLSDYSISNQLVGYLDTVTVRKLSITPVLSPVKPTPVRHEICPVTGYEGIIEKTIQEQFRKDLISRLNDKGIELLPNTLNVNFSSIRWQLATDHYSALAFVKIWGTVQTKTNQTLNFSSKESGNFHPVGEYDLGLEFDHDGLNPDGSPINGRCTLNSYNCSEISVVNEKYNTVVTKFQISPVAIYPVQ